MKPCDRVDSLLSAYLDHEASPAETRIVEDHLKSCPRCSANVSEVAALLPRLARLPRIAVSDGFTGRVLAEVKGLPVPDFDEPAVPRLRPRVAAWGFPLAAAATLALVTVSLLRVWGGPSSDVSLAERGTKFPRLLRGTGAGAPRSGRGRDPGVGLASARCGHAPRNASRPRHAAYRGGQVPRDGPRCLRH